MENTRVPREYGRYKLDLVDVQMIRWGNGGTVRAGVYILFYGKGNKTSIETGDLYTTK